MVLYDEEVKLFSTEKEREEKVWSRDGGVIGTPPNYVGERSLGRRLRVASLGTQSQLGSRSREKPKCLQGGEVEGRGSKGTRCWRIEPQWDSLGGVLVLSIYRKSL